MAKKYIQRIFTLKDEVTPSLKKMKWSTRQYAMETRKLKRMAGPAFAAVKKGVVALGAAGVAGGAGMVVAAKNTAEYGDKVDKMSQRLNLSRKAFQEWDFVLSQNGVSIDQMQMGMKTLTQRMGEASRGAGQGSELFERLGVSVLDNQGNMKSQEQAFEETIAALQAMEDGVEKAEMAQRLFGRSGQELLPLLNGSNESMQKLKKEFQDLGLAIDDSAVDSSVKFIDTMDKFQRVGSAALRKVGVVAMPYLTNGMQWIIDKAPMLRDYAVGAFNVIRDAVDQNRERFAAVTTAFSNIKDSIKGAFAPDGEGGGAINWLAKVGIPALVGAVGGVLSGIAGVYNFFHDNWSMISPIVYGIVGAVAAYSGYIKYLAAQQIILTAKQWALNTAMMANPMGLLIAGGVLLIGVIVFLIKKFTDVTFSLEGFAKGAIGVAESAANAFAKGVHAIRNAVDSMWNGIIDVSEWGVNSFIDKVNGMLEFALKGVNAVIRGINSIPGVSIKEVDFKINKADFSGAKRTLNTEGPKTYDFSSAKDSVGEFINGWKKGPDQNLAADSTLSDLDREKQERIEMQEARTDNLTKALEDNTDTLKSTKGGGNTINVTVNGTDLTAEEIADKLVPRIERKLFAT